MTMNDYTEETIAWLTSWGYCWRCRRRGLWGVSLTAHHFIRGCNRLKNDLKTIVILCADCHDRLEHNYLERDGMEKNALGVLGCLALKFHYDRELYDPKHCCRVAGRAETCWTDVDVSNEMTKLVMRGIIR